MQNNVNNKEKLNETTKSNINDLGTVTLGNDIANESKNAIQLISIIGEIEGHESASNNVKTTKYEHLLPFLASIEDNADIKGVLIILNTLGGDVEAGLSISEMIASLSKPTVSLILGGCHSIGAPLAVAADYSFVVPSGTMVIHPVRTSGQFIGVVQSFRNIVKTQDRITQFIATHSKITVARLETLMLDSNELVKDVGTLLTGQDMVREGIISEVGGIKEAVKKIHELINKNDEH